MGLDWLWNPIAIPRDLIVNPLRNAMGGGDNGSSAPQAPSPQALPEAPKPEVAAEEAEKSVRRRRSQMTQTVFTDPLGISGQADIVRKTLTGQ